MSKKFVWVIGLVSFFICCTPLYAAQQTPVAGETYGTHIGKLNNNDGEIYAHKDTVTGNPHVVTKSDLTIDNVDNTSDVNKPISTSTQTALDAKQVDLDVPSQAEAEAGTATDERVWTSERVKQAIIALAPGGVDEVVYLSDCSGVTNGFCIDTDDGELYYWNDSAIVNIALGPELDTHAGTASAHHVKTVDTNADTECTGDDYYHSGDGNCNDLSAVYEPLLVNEAGLYSALSDVSDFTQPGVIETLTANWINIVSPWADNEVADDITIDLATAATALAANGGNCNAGEYPLGVDASGATESCTDATTEIDSAISTHLAVPASVTVSAHVELATNAETVTGTDTDRAVTPDGLTDKMAAPGEIGGTTPAAGTFTDVTVSPSATPTLFFTDSDTTDEDVSTKIVTNCTDTGSGTEDCDMTFTQQIAGADVDFMTADASAGEVNFSTLNLITTGTIQGDLKVVNKAANATLTAAEINSMVFVTATATITLPAVTIGTSVCVYSTTAAAVHVDVNASDRTRLDGTALADGDKVTSASAAGDFICMVGDSAAGWTTLGRSGTWTDGN